MGSVYEVLLVLFAKPPKGPEPHGTQTRQVNNPSAYVMKADLELAETGLGSSQRGPQGCVIPFPWQQTKGTTLTNQKEA